MTYTKRGRYTILIAFAVEQRQSEACPALGWRLRDLGGSLQEVEVARSQGVWERAWRDGSIAFMRDAAKCWVDVEDPQR